MTDSLTNSLFLYSQPLQLLHRIEELLFERVARWQLEDVTPSRMGQPSRHRQEIPAHGFDCGVGILSGQAQTLEPVYKVVSQHHRVEISNIGEPSTGRDLQCGLFPRDDAGLQFGT